jgi:hypothetical protein
MKKDRNEGGAKRSASIWPVLVFLAVIGGLPLLGAAIWRDEPLAYYFDFPPRLGGVAHAEFSRAVFIGLAALIILCLLPFIVGGIRGAKRAEYGREGEAPQKFRFPRWGYAGVLLCAAAWVLTWTRFSWFQVFQPYTFPFLWVGYVLVVNAFTCRRRGNCLISERPGYFLALFPASAVFWWFFEYLNRFVLNWYYVQIDMFGPFEYIFYASACFSTVLPAVLSTAELLKTFPFFAGAYRNFLVLRPSRPKPMAAAILVLSGAALFALGLFPNLLFPFIWIAPLLCLVSLQTLAGSEHIFSRVKRGDWSRLVTLAVAALVCGFFWEMWNYYSMARWEYSIPYVHRYQVFEMPILGYAGYLPFGLECGAIGDLVKSSLFRRGGINRYLRSPLP